MALIKCLDCGFHHSDVAKACPQCGRPKEKFKSIKDQLTQTSVGLKYFTKSQLSDPKKTLAIGGILIAGIILAPRVIKYSLRIWDPFQEVTSTSQIFWKYDGGYTYTRSNPSVASWGVTWSNNSDSVREECQKMSQYPESTFGEVERNIVSAIPQVKNVNGGTCNGTLQTIETKTIKTGWERFLRQICFSKIGSYWCALNAL